MIFEPQVRAYRRWRGSGPSWSLGQKDDMRIGAAIFLIAAALAGCRQTTVQMVQELYTGVGSHLVEFTETTHNAPQYENQALDEGEILIIVGSTNTVRVTESNLFVNGISHRLDAGDFVKITDGKVVIKPQDKKN